ncbi:MAG: hypothetical protein WCJ51_01385 [Candidatus Moraniibacteriota bacterium]
MFEKIKKISVQILVLLVNAALVGGGVFYLKNEQAQKEAEQKLADAQPEASQTVPVEAIDPIAEKAQQLQQIIQNNSQVAKDSTLKNTGQVTVQKPKTITQTIPGAVQTVTVPATSTPTPAKTTKKS